MKKERLWSLGLVQLQSHCQSHLAPNRPRGRVLTEQGAASEPTQTLPSDPQTGQAVSDPPDWSSLASAPPEESKGP
ncbi:hypothetical protein NQZ68_023752 [Dissostichus eleginoides]|nr:hypothetical protein NQZ68_023752 [Dissostichus eleginoides]